MIFFIFHLHTYVFTYVDYVDKYEFFLFLKSFQRISKNVHLFFIDQNEFQNPPDDVLNRGTLITVEIWFIMKFLETNFNFGKN